MSCWTSSWFSSEVGLKQGVEDGLPIISHSSCKLVQLAQFSTYINGKGDYVRLELLLPGMNSSLVSFNSLLHRGGSGEITFWPGWEDAAPNSSKRIEELIGPVKSNSGIRHRRLSRLRSAELPDILAAIHDAYNEAKRLPNS